MCNQTLPSSFQAQSLPEAWKSEGSVQYLSVPRTALFYTEIAEVVPRM